MTHETDTSASERTIIGEPVRSARPRTAVCCFSERTPDQSVADPIRDAIGNRLACLADGEGHFAIVRRTQRSRGRGIAPRTVNPLFSCAFYVQQRADDKLFLETFAFATGLGRIYDVKAQPTPGRANNPKVRWSVHRTADCVALVRLLDEYPLWSKKAHEYAVWREAVIRWSGPRVVELADWQESYDELRALRVYRGGVQ